MARALGIDLGNHTVKVAILERRMGRYAVSEYLERRVTAPVATGEDGVPGADAPYWQATLQDLIREHDLLQVPVVAVAYPMERASVRTVTLPFVDRNQIARTLPFEVENHVPFEIEDMLLEHRVMGAEGGQSQVLAVLCEKEVLRDRLQQLASVGINPKHLALDGDLLAYYATGGTTQAVLDLGHTRSLLVLARDGRLLAARAICWGGRDLTRRLQKTFNLDEERAERFKHALRLGPAEASPVAAQWDDGDVTVPVALVPEGEPAPDLVKMSRCVEEGLQELVAEIRATLMGFEEEQGLEVANLLLAGGGAQLNGLDALLQRHLGIEVGLVALPTDAGAPRDALRFALVQVLGVRAVGEMRGRPFELRKGEYAHRGQLDILRNLAAYGGVLLAFFALTGIVMFYLRYRELSAELMDLETRIGDEVAAVFPDVERARLEDASMAVAIMQEKTMATTTRVELLGAAIRGEPPMLTLLKELSDGMPAPSEATIDVKDLTLSETAVNLKAETNGYEEAARIEASLQNTQRFKAAKKGDEKKVGEKVSFNLSIPLGAEAIDEEVEG